MPSKDKFGHFTSPKTFTYCLLNIREGGGYLRWKYSGISHLICGRRHIFGGRDGGVWAPNWSTSHDPLCVLTLTCSTQHFANNHLVLLTLCFEHSLVFLTLCFEHLLEFSKICYNRPPNCKHLLIAGQLNTLVQTFIRICTRVQAQSPC